MINKYGKRFRFAPSFNKFLHMTHRKHSLGTKCEVDWEKKCVNMVLFFVKWLKTSHNVFTGVEEKVGAYI